MEEAMAKKESISIEEHFQILEDIIGKLESKDISLEDSFACYKEGMEHLAVCNQMMEQVEKKVKVLSEGGDLTDF